MVDSCRTCHSCQQNEEQYCEEGIILTYAGVDRRGEFTQGGYSTHIVVDEDFVLRIPPRLLSRSRPHCCARASRRTGHSGIGAQGRISGSPSSAWAGSGTWR